MIKPQFDDASLFSEGLATVKSGKYHGYIDKTGAMIIPPQFFEAAQFRDGLAMVKINGKFGVVGFIDHSGKMVIPAQYSEATNFNDGVAAVRKKDTWQLIDVTGKPVIDQEFCK